ncbi:MAG: hypothetical protein KF841_00580 [Phycisphaerae bacterium]|nr:hypothetical protein [Phycisphaerae bacterium]
MTEPCVSNPSAAAGLPRSPSGASPSRRIADVVESAAIFVIGYVFMAFLMNHPDAKPGPEAGLPGNDSFYHVKMAVMMPEVGLVRTFPWLQFAYFTKDGDAFVSHHYGFHVSLIPFTAFSRWLLGDELIGARWAICTYFALVVVIFHAILRSEGVPWRGLWVMAFFLMPIHFYTRHSYVRAISPALFCMLLLCGSMFRGRWILAAIVTALSIHLYLGAVMYAPVVVACFVVASLFGLPEDRRIPWKIAIGTAGAWIAAILLHPYCGNMFEFLRLQVFGSGLTPDIQVGTEWSPYNDVWWFFVLFAGPILGIWTVSLVIRLRLGPRLTANELALVLLNFAFLILTLKARRFIEYWPAFCLVSAAVLAKPGLHAVRQWFRRDLTRTPGTTGLLLRLLWATAGLFIVSWLLVNAWRMSRPREIMLSMAASWRMWVALLIGVSLPCVVAGLRDHFRMTRRTREALWLTPLFAAALIFGLILGSGMWLEVRKINKCSYDVAEIRAMMAAIKADSRPGDIIFTSDWDDFPTYFYYNSYNHYIVGLDPKFTHDRRPDLWERFVRITRGQVPTKSQYKHTDPGGREIREDLDIRIEDIRDYFGARYVISDRDHRPLSAKLAAARDFAELIYPPGDWQQNRNAEYVVFRIKDGRQPSSAPLEEPRR